MEETAIRKLLVVVGLIALIAGTALALVYVEEPYTAIEDLETWDIWPSTLNPPPDPWYRTFWGRLMLKNSWLQLNVSSSNAVRVTISVLESASQMMIPIFDQLGTSFTQKMAIGATGTYQVDIKNEGSEAVDVLGTVIAREEVTRYRRIHHYPLPGTFLALGGAAILIFGIFANPRKRSKSERRAKGTAGR